MKTYKLEIQIDDKVGLTVHEKTEEGVTVMEARLIASVLEEYKLRLFNHILTMQQEVSLKNKPRND